MPLSAATYVTDGWFPRYYFFISRTVIVCPLNYVVDYLLSINSIVLL